MAIGMLLVDSVETIVAAEIDSIKSRKKSDKPRAKRRAFRHVQAHGNIHLDHVGPDPLFGREVKMFFRLSRPRVQVIIEALGNSDNPHFQSFRKDKFGRVGASMEAKVLLPLRVLAYGDAAHNYTDYFQVSPSFARVCCVQFNAMIPKLFGDEYLRLPTADDLRSVNALHKEVHKVDGMLGSLDCMHTYWKNCPVAWQGAYLGRQSGPTIVLEAIADYNLFFWHLSYGYAGAMNDLNILNISPLLKKWTEGSFGDTEAASGVVPFSVGGESFDRMYVLVDGIYPRYSRFVRGLPHPITDSERKFTKWQESARKDIERAFGVLQCKWKILSYPLHTKNTDTIAKLVTCCLLLHNMAVSDRVMDGDVRARYCPFECAEGGVRDKEVPTELPDENDEEFIPIAATVGAAATTDVSHTVARRGKTKERSVTTLSAFEAKLAATVAHRDEWKALKDDKEWARLQTALMRQRGATGRP
jgi:hypothetical protein